MRAAACTVAVSLLLAGCGAEKQDQEVSYQECLASQIVGVNTKDGKLTESQRQTLKRYQDQDCEKLNP